MEYTDIYPFVIYKINKVYYIIDERNDFVHSIYDSSIDAEKIATTLNLNIEQTQENKLSDR